MDTNDISLIISTVTFAIFLMIIILSRVYQRNRKLGRMKLKKQMEMASGEMLYELSSKYKYWKMITIKSLESIDEYINEKLSIYSMESLLADEELIFKLGSFTGEVIKYTMHYKWIEKDDNLYLENNGIFINPYELINQKRNKGKEFSCFKKGVN